MPSDAQAAWSVRDATSRLLRWAVASGSGASVICAAGMATGIFLWVTAVGDGISAFLAAPAVAFTIVKFTGAAA